eukprot:544643-Prymnesium_polylepis.1
MPSRSAPGTAPGSAQNQQNQQPTANSGERQGSTSGEAKAPPALPEGLAIGANVFAIGLHAGEKKTFTAVLLGVRKNSPPFLVKYISDENGRRTALYLPDVRKTYVMAHE